MSPPKKTSCGDEALANLKEAVEGFFEAASSSEIKARLKRPAFFTHFEVNPG